MPGILELTATALALVAAPKMLTPEEVVAFFQRPDFFQGVEALPECEAMLRSATPADVAPILATLATQWAPTTATAH